MRKQNILRGKSKNARVGEDSIFAQYNKDIINMPVGAGLVSARYNNGITLIALVITIIVLLILAGVVLNLTLGENGILNLAQKAGKDYQNASMHEQNELEKLYAEMLNGNLPENTPKTAAGTKVRLPDGWKTATPNYVETAQGKIVKESVEIATVEAIAVGNGETVPVPIGFYYVGGNLESGVVISDNSADQNKFAGQADVPSGLKVDDSGNIVNELVGNQFVWIPCEYEGYVKTNWGQGNVTNRSTSCWDTTVDKAGRVQTKKYGGFYVGRFEAGLAISINEYTDPQPNTGSIYNKEGVPQSKAGIIPWMFIDWEHAEANASSMYNTGTVNSGLITGTQWDVMINKIGSLKDETGVAKYSLIDSGSWGNHLDKEVTGYIGRHATYTTSNRQLSAFSSETQTNGTKAKDSRTLLTTGASNKTRAYNIYDVAGNLWEWTEETSFYGGNTETQYRERRGGSFHLESNPDPVCYRSGIDPVGSIYCSVGFRVVLYMK